MGEKFRPHPNMKKIYHIYLLIAAGIPFIAFLSISVGLYLYFPKYWFPATIGLFTPLAAIVLFVLYWIPKFYESITYLLTEDEVSVEMGVWWKMRHIVPYSRVMSVDVVQGPISRRFGVATVDIYTAGYTGMGGGAVAGIVTRRAEAMIMYVYNPIEVREAALFFVRKRPLFGEGPGDVALQVLNELKRIRTILERSVK